MDWQKKVSLWGAKNFRPLVVALLVGCGVHYTIYANQLGNFDAVHIGALYTADGWPEHLYWETQQGRWALRLVDMLRGGIHQPAAARRAENGVMLCNPGRVWYNRTTP